ncbi:3-alpha-hydroxysteroid dehydrogenase [Parafrankia colletiae]|uniref:3-alpha-hydroxysteroid dehydrogenase n=1 Tax=Parafrankia colletiae TaxID=573497 RepID=A0A1S1QDN7_9ACTN|nr:SDR family oxidoreductase [Parafrankia colletiae]MCK9901965.1 SDR family oxidoreductase [Frankia sp. Cpl3]OHV32908.1 3-alpha-hydroxysteroid dehydrogenase [Parafrankia colletiae]
MGRFDNRTVLVTGGAGGQGSSHVRAYHAEGANVVIAGVSEERGRELADELGGRGERGERVLSVRLDVTDEASWADAIAATERYFGPLSVLVNNAGAQNPAAPVEATDRRVWERILDINLTGTFLGIRAAVPSLRRGGGGVIVNIGSTSGIGGTACYAPYVASKWAVRGLTRTAALELGRDNIRVNAIHPGVIATPFITEPAAGSDAPISDFYSPEPFAIPRMGEPADVTRLLLFISSAEASFATGSEFVVDGGLLLGPALSYEAA